MSHHQQALPMLEGSCLCGRVSWRFDAVPDGTTACNCTACRRYGVLWNYGHEGEDVHVVGDTASYTRPNDLRLRHPLAGGGVRREAQHPGALW
jgi:hypothetical protein